MIAKLQCVVLDCPDVLELARFYRSLLGGEVNRPDPRWSLDEHWSTLHTDGGFVLAFQHAEDHRPPRWGDPARPQQFHLDLGVEDLDGAVAGALALGGTVLDDGEGERGWVVLADPAGHPFCLVREQPSRPGA
ncbi:VOC family protein [Streptomyces filamentosus]|uniref:VOC family protein n=1 Tax=Streptomyces filamentosus TaxID=67294 RepID=UPI0033F9D040